MKSVHVTHSTLYVYIYSTKYTHTGRPDEVRRLQTVSLQDTQVTQKKLFLNTQHNHKWETFLVFFSRARGHACDAGDAEGDQCADRTRHFEVFIMRGRLFGRFGFQVTECVLHLYSASLCFISTQ